MKKWIVLFVLLFTSFPLFAMDYLQIHKSGTGGSGSSAITDLTGFTAIGDSIYGAAGNTSSIMAAGANYSIRYPLSSEATGWANLSPVANAIIGWTSGGVLAALTSHMHADDAEQFYNATDDTKTLKLLLSGNTTGANSTLSFSDTTDSTHSVPPGTNTLAAIQVPNVFTVVQEFNATAGAKIGSTGVLVTSDNDGAITLTGASAGSDEGLTLNLDDTENTVVISSSTGVTDINFSALNLVTTGTIQGGIKISSDADGMTGAEMTTAGMYGTLFIATGAGTWTLPTAVQGMAVCLMDDGTAHDLILDVQADDDMSLKGTEDTNGDGITNATGSTTGDFVCVVATSAGHWKTLGMQGTWTVQ